MTISLTPLPDTVTLDDLLKVFVSTGFFGRYEVQRLFEIAYASHKAIQIVGISLTHWLTDEETPTWLKAQMENTEKAITPSA